MAKAKAAEEERKKRDQLDHFRSQLKMQAERLEADRKKKEELGWVSLSFGFISDLSLEEN